MAIFAKLGSGKLDGLLGVPIQSLEPIFPLPL